MITSSHRRYILPILILLLAFVLRLYHLDFHSIWWDEGHSIFVATHPIPQIPTLPAMDVHPPAYFTLLHLWMTIAGHSEFALRYLSVIFSVLTIALLWRFAAVLSRRFRVLTIVLPGRSTAMIPQPQTALLAALFAPLFAALSPMYVAYAQEVRSYAMITFLAAASTFTLWQLLDANTQSTQTGKRALLLATYIVLSVACLYTHYFTIFLLVFQNIAWLAWIAWKRANLKLNLGGWLGSQSSILLLFTPQLLLAIRQITSYTNPNLIPPRLTYFISRSWQAYTTGLTIDPTLAKWGMGSIATIMLISWLIVFWKSRTKTVVPFIFLTSWLAIPLLAYFIILQRQPSFEPRYLMLVTPALFLLLALGLSQMSHLTSHASRFTFYILLALLYTLPILVFLTGLHSYYTNETYFKDDSASVADWLAAETTPTDIVYIDVPHPFHYYAAKGHIAAPTRYLFVDIHTVAETLTREAAGRNRLYWVTWYGSDTDPRGVIPFLAEKSGHKLGQLDFRGYHVEWFSLPETEPVFSVPTTLTPINATFGDVLRLDGITFGNTTTVDNPTWATFHFTLLRDTNVDYKVSLRLHDEAGNMVYQFPNDKDLLNDRHFRTSAWPLNNPALNQATNVYTLPLPGDLSPGTFQLVAVLYNSQPPYPSEGVSGHENIDGVAAVIGRITVKP